MGALFVGWSVSGFWVTSRKWGGFRQAWRVGSVWDLEPGVYICIGLMIGVSDVAIYKKHGSLYAVSRAACWWTYLFFVKDLKGSQDRLPKKQKGKGLQVLLFTLLSLLQLKILFSLLFF
ncbi:hypothetical protein NMG60_11024506 [Bertholletia excelsa]